MTNSIYLLPKNCNFSVAAENSAITNDCRPVINNEYSSKLKGIIINSAESITWPKNFDSTQSYVSPNGDSKGPIKFMISGLVQLPKNTLDLDGELSHSVVVVAVNQKNAKTYSGKMNRLGFKSPTPLIVNDDEISKSAITRKYFNIDLVTNLELPVIDAIYTVYATLGDYKSNELIVSTKVK